MRRRLVVMVKAPRPGRVKTRLGRQIGMVPAAWWMRHQTTRLLRRLRDPRWDIWLAVAPDISLRDAAWPADLPRVPQGPGDLGDRMGRLLRDLPSGPVCIIGSDIPGITRQHIARAFGALGPAEAVFGPAPDGGFWLVGMKRLGPPPATLFRDVRWSSEHALSDTLATLPGLRVAMVDELNDVDEASDL
ncbi:MAG: hypothetical protein CML03_04920 [Pseudooceanicola sp.]|nr:hypothetical protein [Pseudooceanicola sp.]